MNGRVILAGGGGCLGRLLQRHLRANGHEVVVLSRDPGEGEVAWDGETLGDWTTQLEGALAVINLAGRSVDCRYTAANRRLIMDSRIRPTRVLGEAIARCARPPKVWLNSSTATIYRHTFGPAWDEAGEVGGCAEAKDLFSVEVATAWEREFRAAKTPQTRKVALRVAMVLGQDGGVFPVLRRLVRLGLGGRMGDGRQFMSWIHGDDFVRTVEWLIRTDGFEGIVNLAAPEPVPNAEMMRQLRQALRVPFGLPATRWMLEAGAFFLRTETELIIKSRRVISTRLPAGGFEFRYPRLSSACAELTESPR